jgi:hypothetical protein
MYNLKKQPNLSMLLWLEVIRGRSGLLMASYETRGPWSYSQAPSPVTYQFDQGPPKDK